MLTSLFLQVNTYLQAALHNLKTVRTDLTVAERDRDRYLESSTANFERFRQVERELAEEKERVRTLEAELERTHAEAIAEYKASQEFDDLLAAEYDASFPDTFKACWETIIGELGSQIEGVTLERFPVPPVPGKTPSSPVDLDEAALGDSHPNATQDEDAQDGVESPMAEDAEAKDVEEEDEEVPEKPAEAKEGDDIFDDGLP